MKTIIKLFLSACITASCFLACQKNTVSTHTTTPPLILTLSKSSVKLGEPLFVKAANSNNATIKWSVTPAPTSITAQGTDKSVILFSHPGTYVVSVNYFTDSTMPPSLSDSTTVTVSDSVYNDSIVAHCNVIGVAPIDSSDQIMITPVSFSDTGLVLLANTVNSYNSSPALTYLLPPVLAGEYEFIFNSVTEFPCNANNGPSPATAVLSMGALTPGTHPVIFKLLGVDYKGSVLVTDTGCTFTWPYTTGVVISPLQISK